MSKNLKKISIIFLILLSLFFILSIKVQANTTEVTVTNLTYDESAALEVLTYVNNERAAEGLSSLVWDADLENITNQRAAEIAVYFSHTRTNGESCFTMLSENGINGNYMASGENIALGFSTAESVMEGWMNSSGHRANILNSSYTSIGVSCVTYNGTKYWIQFFGMATGTVNQTPLGYTGTKSVAIEVADAYLYTNLTKIDFDYGESNSNFMYNLWIQSGQQIVFCIKSSSISSLYISVDVTSPTLTSSDSNALSFSGTSMYANDVGSGNITYSYAGLTATVPFSVAPPDMTSVVFNYIFYANTYSDLKAEYGYSEESLREHWEKYGMAEGRTPSPIYNPSYYLSNNSDVAAAVGTDYVAAYNHFINYGIAELRPSSSEYWGNYYKTHNSDLSNFSGYKLAIHYLTYGRSEGRIANANAVQNGGSLEKEKTINVVFDAEYYADTYPDVKAVYGYAEELLENHWLTFGIKEGRKSSRVFDVVYYVNNNLDIKAAFGNDYVAAYNHFINYGINEYRKSSSEYWGQYYKNNYKDLSSMTSVQLIEHYIAFGASEGRVANTVGENIDIANYVFNAQLYYDLYSDLQSAIGYNEEALKNHWLTYGIKEGRTASIVFDAAYYLNKYSDLKSAYGSDYLAAYNHFVIFGIYEGRRASNYFDATYYLTNNSDLSKVYGSSCSQALVHFVLYGMSEGRAGSGSFKVSAYKANNSDLSKAFGNSYLSYYEHYILYGITEGRKTI